MKKCILIALYVMSFCEAADHQPRAGRIPRHIGEDIRAKEHWEELVQKHYNPTNSWLTLSRKNISAIPDNIQGLQNLRQLILQYNQITSIPDNIQGLQNLKALHLQYNQITSIPDNIRGLQNLLMLDLQGNPIAPKDLPDGRTVSAQEQVRQLQNNINATRGANQPKLQIYF